MRIRVVKILTVILSAVLVLLAVASCSNEAEQGPVGPVGDQGPQGPQGVQGEQGEAGNGVESIIKTSTEGLVDTYTITFTDGTKTTFTVTNGADGEQGAQGIQGIRGLPGENGRTPVITIRDGYWHIDGVNTNQSAVGLRGAVGNGISNVAKTSSEGLVDTYTITYTDGSTATFTVTNGSQGVQGIQGEKGEDGRTPVITIQNGKWYIDGIDSGTSAEGVRGEKGNDGENGLSAYEIYIKYHPQYTGTEAEWIESLKGNDGKQGTGVVDAYITEDLHLILVLSDLTEIDAGYVGVSVNKSYTVIFRDYNDAVLKTEKVYEGEAATAPAVKDRIGYRFTGWSRTFDNVTSNLEIVAQYEVEHNQLYISYQDNGDYTMTATLTLCGDVNLYGLEFNLLMDTVGLTYTNVAVKTSGAAANYSNGNIKFSYVCDTGSNVTKETTLLEITFDITGTNSSLEFSLNNVDAFDEEYVDESYALANAAYQN